MNLAELQNLADWIEVELEDEGILPSYTALQGILGQNARGNQQQPFEQEKETLFDKLKAVDLLNLTTEQVSFLDRMGVLRHVGVPAVEQIEDTLYRNSLDVATAAAKIQVSVEALAEGFARAESIREALKGCVDDELALGDEVLIRVGFSGDAAINNVVDFKDWAKKWHEIGRGLAMIHGMAPEEIHVIGASRGSVIIELGVAVKFAASIGSVIIFALEVAERVVRIRKHAIETRGFQFANTKIAEDIEAAAALEREKGAKEIQEKLLREQGLDEEREGDKAVALVRSIDSLLDFLEKGGDVDCVIPQDEELEDGEEPTEGASAKQLQDLRESFSTIRLLEAKVKLLEAGDDPDLS